MESCQSKEASEGMKNARMFLGAIMKQKDSEDVPVAMKKLMECYRAYENEPQTLLHLESTTDDVLRLKDLTEKQLLKLENPNVLIKLKEKVCNSDFISKVSSTVQTCPTQFSAKGHFTQSQSGASVGAVLPHSTVQLTQSNVVQTCQKVDEIGQDLARQLIDSDEDPVEGDLEMQNGERLSPVVVLTRGVHSSIDHQLIGFSEVDRASHSLDNITRRVFGISMYSQGFRNLCIIMGCTGTESDKEFQLALDGIEGLSGRELLKKMRGDASENCSSPLELFKQLEVQVLNRHFYKMTALMLVRSVLNRFPPQFKKLNAKIFLESARLAAITYLLALNDGETDDSQYMKPLQNNIELMMKQLHIMGLMSQ